MISDEADEIINELFESSLSRYQIDLGESIKDNDFIMK